MMPVFCFEVEERLVRRRLVSVQANDQDAAHECLYDALETGRIQLYEEHTVGFQDTRSTLSNQQHDGPPDLVADDFDENEEQMESLMVFGLARNGSELRAEITRPVFNPRAYLYEQEEAACGC